MVTITFSPGSILVPPPAGDPAIPPAPPATGPAALPAPLEVPPHPVAFWEAAVKQSTNATQECANAQTQWAKEKAKALVRTYVYLHM